MLNHSTVCWMLDRMCSLGCHLFGWWRLFIYNISSLYYVSFPYKVYNCKLSCRCCKWTIDDDSDNRERVTLFIEKRLPCVPRHIIPKNNVFSRWTQYMYVPKVVSSLSLFFHLLDRCWWFLRNFTTLIHFVGIWFYSILQSFADSFIAFVVLVYRIEQSKTYSFPY